MTGRCSWVFVCLCLGLISGCSKPPAPSAPPALPVPAQNVSVPQTPPAAVVETAKAVAAPVVVEEKPLVAEDDMPKPVEPNSEPKAGSVSPKEMLKQSGTGVVLITMYDALGEKAGFGSGCIIGKGQILTNYHVVAPAVSAKVQPRGTGDGLLGTAQDVVGYKVLDEKNDLAVLTVNGLPDNLHVFTFADADKLEQYDKVFAIGHPDGLKFSTSPGFVNAMMKTSDLPEQLQVYLKNPDTQWIQTDAVISGGSSGGPLLNEKGEIVGINTLRVGVRTGLAVSVQHVKDLLETVAETDSPLPVPDSNVLVTREVAEIKRGYDLEFRQFMMDMQQAREDVAKMRQLARKNNPGPECVHRCLEIIKKHRGAAEGDDAIRLCSMILISSGGRMGFGRHYFDELLDEAAQDPTLIPASVRVIGSLYGLAYSPALDRFLRSVMKGDGKDDVKGVAGTVLVSAMQVSSESNIESEMLELAKCTKDQFGEEKFKGKTLADYLTPAIEGRTFAVGSVAPEIEGKDADGKEFRLSDYRGKIVVIDFWADWCPHCRAMYSHERDMIEHLKDQPFALLGVNGDEPARAKRVIKSGSVTWRSWLDGPNGPIGEKYQIESWPTVYVLDKEGRIRFKDLRGEELETAVNSLLNDVPFLSAQDLIAANAEWKYQLVKNVDGLAQWQQSDFDDSGWASGAAPFGYEHERTKLDSAEPGQRPLTTLFRRKFDLPAGDRPEKLLLKVSYRDGVAVSINGKEVFRDQLKVDSALDSPAFSRGSDEQAEGTAVAIDASQLKPTDNLVTVELHQFSAYSAQPLFQLTLGTPPDLVALMEKATATQKVEICNLINQAYGLKGSDEVLKQMQSDESQEMRVRAAVAAALNDLPVSLSKLSDPNAHQFLAQSVVHLNQRAWEMVSRSDLSSTQYARAARAANAAYTLLSHLQPPAKSAMEVLINTHGVALYRVGQFEKSQEVLKESVDAHGENPVDAGYLSLVLRSLGKTDEAQEKRQQMNKMLASDEWKHDQSGREAQKEVEQVFSK